LTLLFAVGVSGVFICFSYEIGTYIYSSEEAADFIKMLAPLIPLMYLDGSVDAMLKGLGEQLYTMRVNIIDSLISVFLLVFMLPSFGIKGYVAVIFITEIFNTSCSIIKLLEITNVKPSLIKWLFKPLCTVIFSTCIIRLFFDLGFFSKIFGIVPYGKALAVLEIFLTSVMYILFAKIFGAISKDDIKWAKKLLKS
jgi:stage V sporulation protein B